MNKKREHILSLTKKDFDISTFKSGGKGGQHQNKTDSAVRIKHIETGLSAESREGKSQHQNKKIAFRRLTKSVEFVSWLKMKSNEIIKKRTISEEVDMITQPEHIKVEVKQNGRWVDEKEIINE